MRELCVLTISSLLKRNMLQQIPVDKDALFHHVVPIYDEYMKNENTQIFSCYHENLLMIEAEFVTIWATLAESVFNKLWFILKWLISYIWVERELVYLFLEMHTALLR